MLNARQWCLVLSICVTTATLSSVASPDTRAQLIGSWHGPIFLNGRDVYTTIDYRSDGSLSARIEYEGGGRFRFVERLWGSWEIRDGQLVTVTHSNEGMTEKKAQEIVSITKSLLILRDREGHVSTEQR